MANIISVSRPSLPHLILFNKPFGVLCRFSDDGSGKPALASFVRVLEVYRAGRLDIDSEGLESNCPLARRHHGMLSNPIAPQSVRGSSPLADLVRGQRGFLAIVAVKSGSLLATQSTNLRTAGLASRPSTSIP